MNEDRKNSGADVTPYILGKLKFIAEIALIAQAVSALLLVALVMMLASEPETNYLEIITATGFAHENLLPVTVLSALITIGITAGGTWLVAVYSAFRIAGPIYGFSRNIDAGRQNGRVPYVASREDGRLRDEAELLNKTADVISAHHDEIASLCGRLEQAVEDHGAAAPPARKAFEDLRKAVDLARL